MKSLMRPGTGDHVWWMMPSARVAVLDRLRDHAQRDEVVDPLEIDLLALQLEMNAVEALDAAVELNDRHLRVLELGAERARQLVDDRLGALALGLDLGAQRFVGLRLEILERQLLELVLDLAHAEAVGDGRVDVERLLRDLDAPLLRQVVQRPHVVQPVGELDQDDADVIHHRQQHLAEVLGLALLARRERNRADLGDALDDVGDLGAEELGDALGRRQRVLDDVVQQAGGDGHDVELHVREEVGDFERVNEIRLAGMAHLSLVLEGGEDVRPPQELEVRLGAVGSSLSRGGSRIES